MSSADEDLAQLKKDYAEEVDTGKKADDAHGAFMDAEDTYIAAKHSGVKPSELADLKRMMDSANTLDVTLYNNFTASEDKFYNDSNKIAKNFNIDSKTLPTYNQETMMKVLGNAVASADAHAKAEQGVSGDNSTYKAPVGTTTNSTPAHPGLSRADIISAYTTAGKNPPTEDEISWSIAVSQNNGETVDDLVATLQNTAPASGAVTSDPTPPSPLAPEAIQKVFKSEMHREARQDEVDVYAASGMTSSQLKTLVDSFPDAHPSSGGGQKPAKPQTAAVPSVPLTETDVQNVFHAQMDRDARADEVAAFTASGISKKALTTQVAGYADSLNQKVSDSSIQNIFTSEMGREARPDELDAYKASGMTGKELKAQVQTYPDSLVAQGKMPGSVPVGGGFQATSGPNPPTASATVGAAASASPTDSPTTSIASPASPADHDAQVQAAFSAIMGRPARADETVAFAATSVDAVKAQISTYPDSIANAPNTKVDTATINAIFNAQMGRPARQDELDAYAASGMTNQQLKDKVDAFPDSLKSQAAASSSAPHTPVPVTAPVVASVDAKALAIAQSMVAAAPAPAPVNDHDSQVQAVFGQVMGRAARQDELNAFASMSPDSVKAQISAYPDSLANSASTTVNTATIQAIFQSEMGRQPRQDELDAYNAAGMTNQQLRDRVNAFPDSLKSQAASGARLDTGFAASQNNAAVLALGGSTPGQSGGTTGLRNP